MTNVGSQPNHDSQQHKELSGNAHISPPRVGVLDFNPIQYHSPLYQRLAGLGKVALDVLFISDNGHREYFDTEFGVSVAWDIDLLSGYNHSFLNTDGLTKKADSANRLIRWVKRHDVIIIHGYSNPWMLFTAFVCRTRGVPYLIRGDSTPEGQSTGFRSHLRSIVARIVVSNSGGGLAIGQLNSEFYRRFGAPRIISAPYSVDDERFSGVPAVKRADLLAQWNLDSDRPVIIFSGKLSPRKRPLDVIAAVKLLHTKVTTIFVGDGSQADDIRKSLPPGSGIVAGFINQSEIASYYHAADILVLPSEVEPWGLVVNEAMAAGVVPVVSDRVGAAPDLVRGVGEIYPCGNITYLAEALDRTLERVKDPAIRNMMKLHVARYSIKHTVAGFEQAAQAVMRERRSTRRQLTDGSGFS